MTETAKRIFALVKAKKLTQKEFAKRCGVSEKVVSQWKGDSRSYEKYLPQIADALEVPVGVIIGAENNSGSADEAELVASTPAEKYLLSLLQGASEEEQDRLVELVRAALKMQGLQK